MPTIHLTEAEARSLRACASEGHANAHQTIAPLWKALFDKIDRSLIEEVLSGDPPKFVWLPITDFSPEELEGFGMVLIRRTTERFQSYPRVARFVQVDGLPSQNGIAIFGKWKGRHGGSVCVQARDLREGWATEIMFFDKPRNALEEPNKAGFFFRSNDEKEK